MITRMTITLVAVLLAASAWARPSIFFVGAHPDDSEGFAATAFLLRGRECGFAYAETFTTYDGKPIENGVLSSLPHKLAK